MSDYTTDTGEIVYMTEIQAQAGRKNPISSNLFEIKLHFNRKNTAIKLLYSCVNMLPYIFYMYVKEIEQLTL